MLTTSLAVLAGYLAGAIPFAYVIGRLHGLDIRRQGNGNVGAGNLARVCGLPAGAVAALGDGLKGFLPMVAAQRLGLPDAAVVAVAAAAVAGHNWSVFLGFGGGRGLATTVGVVVALDPKLLVWPAVWSMAGWVIGGGLAGFVAWVTLPGLAAWLGQPALTVSVLVVLPVIVVVRRVFPPGRRGLEPSGALTRAVFDTDRVSEPRTTLE